jgi:hypothetical protein
MDETAGVGVVLPPPEPPDPEPEPPEVEAPPPHPAIPGVIESAKTKARKDKGDNLQNTLSLTNPLFWPDIVD